MEKKIKIKNKVEVILFDVDKPISSLWIGADMEEESGTYLLVFNTEHQCCGMISLGFGNFIREIYISDIQCTMNGLRHDLKAGSYTIVLIPFCDYTEKELEITINIKTNINKVYDEKYCQEENQKIQVPFDYITDDTHRYYKGDFHGHTIYSDGHNSIFEACDILMKQKLDFMAFTEHNSLPFGFRILPCLSIPSVELTLPIGHVNLHGVPDMSSLAPVFTHLGEAGSYDELLQYAVGALKDTCNISLNHIFMEPWHFTSEKFDMSQLNTLEVICDPTYASASEANDKAAAFLDFLWQEGYRIYGIGGSDSHNKLEEYYEGAAEPSIYGDPATYVYCEGLSVTNVLEGIKAGHCYTARYIELEIHICNDTYLPGDSVKDEEVITYKVKIKNNKRRICGYFVLNGNIVKEEWIETDTGAMEFKLENGCNEWWLRFGISDEENHIIAYVNPVYNRLRDIRTRSFKLLRDKFGEKYDQRNLI